MDPFTTERLSVRSWRPILADQAARQRLEAALALILSRRVLEHLPPALQLHDQSAGISSWVDARAAESDVFLVEWSHNSRPVGLLIVAADPNEGQTPVLHLGYLLAETAWGQGVASELVAGFVHALRNDGPLMLLGGVSKDNPASARVLEKAGFAISADLATQTSNIYVRAID